MEDLNTYLNQLDHFRASDQARERLVNELFARLRSLSEENGHLKNDFASERDIRRNYQNIVEEQKREAREKERQFENNSFVLALIDGDGAIFQDALLQAAGGDGGSEAASRLHQAIRTHIATIHDKSDSWPVMVHIYLSLDKLAAKLAQVGFLRTPVELRLFAQRFSVNQPLFSIIDVGQGKERADHKIKEMLRTFSDNPTCRHIIFGGCHDAGYLLNLEQFKHDAAKAARITLLETTPAYKGFVDLAYFKRASFDDVFRKDQLPESGPSHINQYYMNQSTPTTTVPNPPSQRSPEQAPTVLRSNTNGSSRASANSPVPSVSASSTSEPPPSEAPTDTSWATVGKTGVVTNGNISIASNNKVNKKKKYAYYNKQEQRLDEPLPPRDNAAAASLEDRMKRSGKKMCNHWHLGGKCENGKFCAFQHEPRLTTGELNALRYKTRSLACKNRYCENLDCYLGHQCALERDYGRCSFPDSCHLRVAHGMDKTKYVRFDQDGNEEYA